MPVRVLLFTLVGDITEVTLCEKRWLATPRTVPAHDSGA